MINSNSDIINKWFSDRGDFTHNINYDLNENSNIIDLGGYNGTWANQMVEKYNPNIYIIEPVTIFYNSMVSKFIKNKKVKLLNVGVGVEDKDGIIYMNNDGTSSNLTNGEIINVKLNTIDTILSKFGLTEIDLIQINIEGDEYILLEYMLDNSIVNKFKNIQVQFHLGIDNDVIRRDNIRNRLMTYGFKLKFDYPFVWESWAKIK